MTGGREGSAPAEPLSRILSVGVLRCRRDSDKTRECFRKFGHRQDRLRGRSCRMQVVPARRSRGTDVDGCGGRRGSPQDW